MVITIENIFLTSGIALGLVCYALIAKWYLVPVLDKYPREIALPPLIFLHCFRYIGLAFLVTGVVAADIAPAFASPAGYGDLLTALLALISVIALRNRWHVAITLVWVFNVVGTLDLLNALFQGLLHIRAGQLGGAYLIPSLIVPALLVSHFLIFRILLGRTKITARARR
jgi:hypothetical protein